MKKLLFISYHYPPVGGQGLPGSQRAVKFLRNFRRLKSCVLTLRPGSYPCDAELNYQLHLPIRDELIIRTGCFDFFKPLRIVKNILRALLRGGAKSSSLEGGGAEVRVDKEKGLLQRSKDFLYLLCHFPDGASGWVVPAVYAGCRHVKNEKVDMVFASGMPWSSLLVALIINRLTGVPFAADFRDPWVGNPFHLSKGRLLDWVELKLEKAVVENAAFVSLNTAALRGEFVARYPHVPMEKFEVFPNGFDPVDFNFIEARVGTCIDSRELVIAHAGFLYGKRDPSCLIEAIKKVDGRGGLKVVFEQIGDIDLGYDFQKVNSGLIDEGRVRLVDALPYSECLQRLCCADVLLLVQPGTKTQVPSKLYDYLFFNKPILSITPHGGALATLINDNHFGYVYAPDNISGIAHCLAELAVEKNKSGVLSRSYTYRDKFSVDSISQRLESKIIECCS